MPEVPVSVAWQMKALLHEVWQEFVEHQPICPRCGAPWAEHGWDHRSAYGERISAACENGHEFVDFEDDFVIQEVTDDDDQASE
jgi:ribosomal protein S27AE